MKPLSATHAAYRALPYWMQAWLWLAVDSALVLVIARFWA